MAAGYPNLPQQLLSYAGITLPSELTTTRISNLDNTPPDNAITDAGATLGRVLFYDVNLSLNNTVSCASCHQQSNAFTDPDRFSIGFDGVLTDRNSMSILNARWYDNGKFFWDERAASLEDQALQPIISVVEMGMDLDDLNLKLAAIDYYPTLFTAAFGDNQITSERIGKALAQFQRSIVSFDSKFDDGIRLGHAINQDFSNFSAQENLGKDLFLGGREPGETRPGINCASCHMDGFDQPDPNEAIFKDIIARNIGLDANDNVTDLGVGAVTGNVADNGKFKTPSLRNVALTGPYMHDGRLATLNDVISHYRNGIEDHPNLDDRLKDGGQPQRTNYSDNERAALIAFLNTLTDATIATNPLWSDPFNESDCTSELLTLSTDILNGTYRKVSQDIETTGTVNLQNNAGAVLTAANAITLKPGFSVEAGSELLLSIDDCETTSYLVVEDAPSMARNTVENPSFDFDIEFVEAVHQLNVSVYPNPFSYQLTIDLGTYQEKGVDIHIFNTLGQTVKNLTIQEQSTIDMSSFDDGIYFVRVIDNGVLITTKKVIKG